jgi:hypothetical protein
MPLPYTGKELGKIRGIRGINTPLLSPNFKAQPFSDSQLLESSTAIFSQQTTGLFHGLCFNKLTIALTNLSGSTGLVMCI